MSDDSPEPRPKHGATSGESEPREERRHGELTEAARKAAADRAQHLLQQLYAISKLLTRFETAERTVPRVLATLGEAVPLRVAILLVRERDGDPRMAAHTFTWHSPGIDEAPVRAVERRGAEALAYLMPSDSPRSSDVANGARAELPSGGSMDTASQDSQEPFLALPLVVGHAPIFGSVAMQGAGPLDESDLTFVNAAVNQLAIAIDRAVAAEARQARTEARREVAEASERVARAELAQQQSEAHYRSMIGQVKDYAIFSMDPIGRITSWNEGVGQVLGFAEAEFLGQDVGALIFTPEDVEAGVPRGELEQAAVSGAASDDRWMMRKDRSRFFAAGVTTAVRDERGALIGFAKVLRDQTQAKRLEQALREADQRKNEFLATLAHELRNPLAPLRNAVQLIKMAGNDPSIVVPARMLMERQLMQMVRLIDDLLDLSRVTSGRLDLHLEHVKLQSILESAVETSRPLIESQEHTLSVSLPEEPIVLNADPTRLAQVFSNLLNNSAKYTDRGGRISLAAARRGNEAVISVTDTGIGIPREMLEKVFEMFMQIDRFGAISRSGLGVGLTLVRRLVRMHGGAIEARSEGAGLGSEFIVRLPIGESAPLGTASDVGQSERAPASQRLRILVADDNEDAANSLAMILQMMGHDTHVARDGTEALELAAALHPQVAVLDIGMPGLTGYEVARRIRAQPWGGDMALVALTGWGQREDKARTKEAGFDGHLVKPVSVSDLEGTFARLRS